MVLIFTRNLFSSVVYSSEAKYSTDLHKNSFLSVVHSFEAEYSTDLHNKSFIIRCL